MILADMALAVQTPGEPKPYGVVRQGSPMGW